MKKMNKSELIEKIGQEWIFLTVGEAVGACNFMLHTTKPDLVKEEQGTWNNVWDEMHVILCIRNWATYMWGLIQSKRNDRVSFIRVVRCLSHSWKHSFFLLPTYIYIYNVYRKEIINEIYQQLDLCASLANLALSMFCFSFLVKKKFSSLTIIKYYIYRTIETHAILYPNTKSGKKNVLLIWTKPISRTNK